MRLLLVLVGQDVVQGTADQNCSDWPSTQPLGLHCTGIASIVASVLKRMPQTAAAAVVAALFLVDVA